MDHQSIVKQFQNINTWKSKGTRAPHKPLLMLLALGEIQRGNTGFIPYAFIGPKLKDLLEDFGPTRKSIDPTLPFIRLANDRLWEFNKPELLNTKQDYPTKFLLSHDLQGKFPEAVVQQLQHDPVLLMSLAELILSQNFPETLHQDILDAVGLEIALNPSITKIVRRRNPDFRVNILRAYEYRCAVCGFSVRLQNKILALEAAHIKWHQAGGPDVEVNGLALCATHHKLFDLGAFTINEDLRMLVSDEVNGQGSDDWLLRHHGVQIRPPQKKSFYPSADFTFWHATEVFKGGYRD